VSGDALGRLLVEHDSWLTVERGLAPNSLAAYRRDLRRYATFLAERGIEDPATIDEAVVRAYVDRLSAEPGANGAPRRAPASVARALVAVRSFHGFCVHEGLLDSDPSASVGAPRVPAGIPKALDEAEVEALLAAVDGDDPVALRDRALLELLYATGIRIGEAVGLSLADIDADSATLRVLGKGAKERVVPVGRIALDALDCYLAAGRPELVRAGRGRSGADTAVFLNTRGGRLSRQSCWAVVRRAGTRAGLGDRLHPHVLRHSAATHMLDHGADLRVVQELLGHASISTTQVYTKVSPTRLRAVYDAAHPRSRSTRPAGGGGTLSG